MYNKKIGFRLEAKTKGLLIKICKNRGEDLSDFVRRAVYKELAELSFLSSEQKKALGVRNEKMNGDD